MSTFRLTLVAAAIVAIASGQVLTAQESTLGQQPTNAQNDQRSDQQYKQNAQRGDRYQTHSASQNDHQKGSVTVQEAIVQKLKKTNEAEIELARFAEQQTDNQQVKQLARQIIQDHQSLDQELQKFASKNDSSQPDDRRQGTTGQSTQNRLNNLASAQNAMRGSQSATVPPQLCDIAEQACDNALQMTKEMLGNYQGQDFDMAFIGQQCVAHTMMLAELKAIQSAGPEELQSIAKQAANKVEKHLEKAKQLAKKLEDDRKVKQSRS